LISIYRKVIEQISFPRIFLRIRIFALMQVPKKVLPLIIFSQFCCTSLWFASNAVMSNLVEDFGLSLNALGDLTSSVQFGFISGTLLFAIFTIADRFSPSKVFLMSAILGSIANLGLIWSGNTITTLLIFRFVTGFFLAGIYPVGMKIAADYFDKGLGKSLGFLVGALVLGTAFPHLLNNITSAIPWNYVIITTTLLAILGGGLIFFFVSNGPYRKASQKFDVHATSKVFKNQKLRSAAFGYFGHMWELYAFWTFIPVILGQYQRHHNIAELNISLWSFLIIGIGCLSCIQGGIYSLRVGVKKVASVSLTSSAICCVLFPLLFFYSSPFIFLAFLLFWGMVVVSDSPMFSTLIAQNASPESKGTALTIVNCIGFAITIVSIQLLSNLLSQYESVYFYLILILGPIFGIISIRKV